MKLAVFFIALYCLVDCEAQRGANVTQTSIPVFRQVSYPFLPAVTSDYFFFSSDGLMWFSSAEGLTSFDGSGVVYHSDRTQANQFGLMRIHRIAEDRNHNFYISSSQGLIYFDRRGKSFSSILYRFSDSETKVAVPAISFYIDRDNIVYAGSGTYGLFIYDPVSKKIEHYNLDSSKPDNWSSRRDNTITSFLEYPGNGRRLWVGSFNGIYSFDKDTKKFSKNFKIVSPPHGYLGEAATSDYDVEEMDMTNDSTIWFNSWSGGFTKYNTHTGGFLVYTRVKNPRTGKDVSGYVIPSFARLDDGNYLLGITDKQPAVFNPNDGSLNFFSVTSDTLLNDAIRYVQKDQQGNIWMIRNGMFYISMPVYSRVQSRKLIRNYSGKYQAELRGIYFDEKSRQYYCAVRFSTGVHVLDSAFNPVRIIPTPLFTNYYTNNETCTDKIIKDGSGRFWTTGWETYVLAPGQSRFEHVSKLFPSLTWINSKGEFADMVATKTGDILLQKAIDGDVYIINHVNMHTDSIPVPRFINEKHTKIANSSLWYDSLRNVAYLTNNGDIIQYNLDQKRARIIPEKEVFGSDATGQSILRLSGDAEGRLWILKEKYGVRIIDPGTLLCRDSIPFGSGGLLGNYYTDIRYGGKDCMFLQSLNGIVIYNYQLKQSFLFDNSNGLPYPVPPALLYCHDHLVVGQRNAIAYYNLSRLTKINLHPRPGLNKVMADTVAVFNGEAGGAEKIVLRHDQNTITLSFSAPEFIFPERIEYAYLLEGVNKGWQYAAYFSRNVTYHDLSPGKYIFHLKAQMQGGNWDSSPIDYTIVIQPAFWQTNLFTALCFVVAAGILYVVVRYRIRAVRREEKVKAKHEKELLELEAKALRAQMNPHFIFNCLNSIKSLMQEKENDKGVIYLTTFSKLIRTLFNNADKKEITLYDEIETCRLYLQLEAMRFDSKFSYAINVDDSIDLKSAYVPALIIQPFIENAIWHGIVPKGSGGNVTLNVSKNNGAIEVIIEDDGIGREASMQNKAASNIGHQSKGVNLTQLRLELDNLLLQRHAKLDIIDKKAGGTKVVIKLIPES